MLGFGDKAVEYFRMINPIEHSKTKDSVMKYKVEPYVIPADIYGQGNLAGRGGWTWYTGSSSWMYIAGIKYILGLNIEKGHMSFKPAISNEWKEYSLRYRYYETIYNIKVLNKKIDNQKINIKLNGEIVLDGKVMLVNDGSVNEIEVILE